MNTLNGFQKMRINFQINRLAKKRAFAVSCNLPTTAFDRMIKAKEDALRDPVKPEQVVVEEINGEQLTSSDVSVPEKA